MKTLYLHIGMPKTGTTAIQNFCHENRTILNQKGCDYPKFPHIYGDTIARVRNGHFLTPEEFVSNKEVFRTNMDSILENFQRFPNIILSDEAIWNAPSKYRGLWKALKEESSRGGFEIKVIVYLRRQDLYLSSIWNQYVKGKSETQPWDDFVKKPGKAGKMNYGTNLAHMSSVLGKDALIVRRFEPKQFAGGSIYADFLQAVGLEMTDEYIFSQFVRNTKLAGNTHEIMRIVNGMPDMDYAANRFFSRALLSYTDVSGAAYPAEMFAKEEAAAFMQKYEEENKRVSETFFDGGELFDMKWKDAPKWEKDNPYMTDDIVRFVVSCCMQLMEKNEQLSNDVARLRDELKHPLRTICKKISGRR